MKKAKRKPGKPKKVSTELPIPKRASMAALVRLTGIPKKLFILAKHHGFPGFTPNGMVVWAVLGPEMEKRMGELQEAVKTSSIGLKEELQKREIVIKDLTIQKMRGQMLDPNDVKQLLVELATSTSAVIKKELGELPPRLAGRSEVDCKIEIDKAMAGIFRILKSGESKLKKFNE